MSYLEHGSRVQHHLVHEAVREAITFILDHDLFRDDDKRYQKLIYPHYYHYDMLRFLVAAARLNYPLDERMGQAVQ